jgi:hypothetical protein
MVEQVLSEYQDGQILLLDTSLIGLHTVDGECMLYELGVGRRGLHNVSFEDIEASQERLNDVDRLINLPRTVIIEEVRKEASHGLEGLNEAIIYFDRIFKLKHNKGKKEINDHDFKLGKLDELADKFARTMRHLNHRDIREKFTKFQRREYNGLFEIANSLYQDQDRKHFYKRIGKKGYDEAENEIPLNTDKHLVTTAFVLANSLACEYSILISGDNGIPKLVSRMYYETNRLNIFRGADGKVKIFNPRPEWNCYVGVDSANDTETVVRVLSPLQA